MSRIVSLRRTEPAVLDMGVLLRLETSLGEERSREVLSDACCAIIEKLTRFEVARDPAEARAASACAVGVDATARSATAARMLRVGEASLDTLLSRQTAS